MEVQLKFIKKVVSILATGITLVTFLISEFCTEPKGPNYIEYTDLSKFYLNIYIFCLLLLCFIHSINSTMICSIFLNRLGIITTDKGKIVLISAIFFMYFYTGSKPQKIFGIISFLSASGLLITELLINRNTSKSFVQEKKESTNNVESNTSKQ